MRMALSHNAGWAAVPLIVLVGLVYGFVVSLVLSRQPAQSPGKKAGLPLPRLTFYDLYAMFGVGPFLRDEWPVLQSAANELEDQSLARLRPRGRRR
jgi:hypothetical protein